MAHNTTSQRPQSEVLRALAPEGVCVRENRSRPKGCAREIPCVNERVFRLGAPLHTALPRPVEPTRALVSGEAE